MVQVSFFSKFEIFSLFNSLTLEFFFNFLFDLSGSRYSYRRFEVLTLTIINCGRILWPGRPFLWISIRIQLITLAPVLGDCQKSENPKEILSSSKIAQTWHLPFENRACWLYLDHQIPYRKENPSKIVWLKKCNRTYERNIVQAGN